MLEGNSNLQIYKMTPIGLHLCDGTHNLCIWTLMNKLQNMHYPWLHICIELGQTCCNHDGNNEKHQRYIPWPHMCIELGIISHQLIVVRSNNRHLDQHPWVQSIRLKPLTCSPDECMHYTPAPSDLKINLRRTSHHWTNLVKDSPED